jgi:hypothetical protein
MDPAGCAESGTDNRRIPTFISATFRDVVE